jgi:hypothetical protein
LRLSPSHFNRRLHALAAWLSLTVGTCIAKAQAAIYDFVIASLPGPVRRGSGPRSLT